MLNFEQKFQTHRGYWIDGAMENTLESLMAAKEQGSQMVEFDVRLTHDYVPVLYHDDNLKRLHKAPVNMSTLTLEQARIFAPELTTLEEVLKSTKVPDFLNIELKTESTFDPALEIKVTQLIKKYKAEDRALLSSFNPFSLGRAKLLNPDISRALLVSEEDEPKNYWFLKSMSLLALCEPQFLHWDQAMTTADKAEKYLGLGYQIAVYTVNDSEQAEKFFSWGVQSIITDRLL